MIINNLKDLKLKKNSFIFHAGTKLIQDKIYSIGGRVLNITSIGNNLAKARKDIIKIIKKINWKSGFFRKDIGWKIIK
jgi:phosphoribosylamine--glycine ligase